MRQMPDLSSDGKWRLKNGWEICFPPAGGCAVPRRLIAIMNSRAKIPGVRGAVLLSLW